MKSKLLPLISLSLSVALMFSPGTARATELDVTRVYSYERSAAGLKLTQAFAETGAEVSSATLEDYERLAQQVSSAVAKFSEGDALKAVMLMENWASAYTPDFTNRHVSINDLFREDKLVNHAVRAAAYADILRRAGYSVSSIDDSQNSTVRVVYAEQSLCYVAGFLFSTGLRKMGDGFFSLRDKPSQQAFLTAAKTVFDTYIKNKDEFETAGIAGFMKGQSFVVAKAWRCLPENEFTLTPLTDEQAVQTAGIIVDDKKYQSTLIEYHTASSLANYNKGKKFPTLLSETSIYSEKDLRRRADTYLAALGK